MIFSEEGAIIIPHFSIEIKLPKNFIKLAINKEGDKWIGTWSGLAKYDDLNWTVYDTINSGIPDNRIRTIAIDNRGNKWIGTDLGGIIKFDEKRWTIFNNSNSPIQSNRIYALTIDCAGYKWMGTDMGMAVYQKDGVNIENKEKEELVPIPYPILLFQNYPLIRVSFSIDKSQCIRVKIFDIKGRCVQQLADKIVKSGNHQLQSNYSSFPNGTYILYFYSELYGTLTQKLLLFRK